MIATKLQTVRECICQAERDWGRPSGAVRLLAVSKGQNVRAIREAVSAGQRAFGESYLQEALEKINALSAERLEWHFIGTLQANKTRAVAENFTWVHSVNRYKIAERLNQQRPEALPPLNVCLEVNISGDPAKSGVSVTDLIDLARQVQRLPRLRLRGLMAIPASSTGFQQLADLQRQLIAQGFALDTLSMGMSNDFEAAIAAGSTWVRIGAAIFGERVKGLR